MYYEIWQLTMVLFNKQHWWCVNVAIASHAIHKLLNMFFYNLLFSFVYILKKNMLCFTSSSIALRYRYIPILKSEKWQKPASSKDY